MVVCRAVRTLLVMLLLACPPARSSAPEPVGRSAAPPPADWCPAALPPDTVRGNTGAAVPLDPRLTEGPPDDTANGDKDAVATAGTPFGEMDIAPSTAWQPVGGEVRFTIANVGAQPEHVRVFFAWADGLKPGPSKTCARSPSVRFVATTATAAGTGYVYAARVPGELQSPVVDGWNHRAAWYSLAPPPAVVFVSAIAPAAMPGGGAGTPTPILLGRLVGITTTWVALALALMLLAAGWIVLARWAANRVIAGGPLLRIISTPDGSASLSQFQILIWTGVIGTGVTYVMLLTGNLIDVPLTTLGLLGVTGLALVGSKLTSAPDAALAAKDAPGAVTALAVVGAPTDTTMVLTWVPPTDTPQPLSYTVQKRLAGAAVWDTVATGIAAPPYAVQGLVKDTGYDFQVFAMNAAAAGAAATLPGQRTAAAPAGVPAAALGQVGGLGAVGQKDGSVRLTWSPLLPAPQGYTVQYREAGTLPWSTAETTADATRTLRGLRGGTRYQFQVFAVGGGAQGAPSALASAPTSVRVPQWSDLVMGGASNVEIDLGRLQMLVFTTIAAGFTAGTLIDLGQIPDIPTGELGLVGLSNGIYLAHKMVLRGR